MHRAPLLLSRPLRRTFTAPARPPICLAPTRAHSLHSTSRRSVSTRTGRTRSSTLPTSRRRRRLSRVLPALLAVLAAPAHTPPPLSASTATRRTATTLPSTTAATSTPDRLEPSPSRSPAPMTLSSYGLELLLTLAGPAPTPCSM